MKGNKWKRIPGIKISQNIDLIESIPEDPLENLHENEKIIDMEMENGAWVSKEDKAEWKKTHGIEE